MLGCAVFVIMGGVLALTTGYYLSHVRHASAVLAQSQQMLAASRQAQLVQMALVLDGGSDIQFMEKGGGPLVDTFAASARHIYLGASQLQTEPLLDNDYAQRLLHDISNDVHSYELHFGQLKEALQKRGFKDYGLEGQMRRVAHALEATALDRAAVLTLRRHEKDFFLRRDQQYALALNEAADALKLQVAQAGGREESIIAIEQYQGLFNEIVSLDLQIGADNRRGLRGLLHQDAANLQQNLLALRSHLAQQMQDSGQLSRALLLLCFLGMLVVAVLVALTITRRVARPISLLHRAMQAHEEGQDPMRHLRKIKPDDETGQLAQLFQHLVEEQARLLDEQRQQNQSLQALVAGNEKRAWRHEGLQRLSAVNNSHRQDLQQLGREWLAVLVPYIRAGQAAIYVVDHSLGQPLLVQMALYAFDKARPAGQTIAPGDGLVGQAWLEGESSLINQVPPTYWKITSGLGHALPTTVALVPLKFDQQVVGVLELASLYEITPQHLAFAEQAGGQLAAVITAIRQEQHTRQLLDHARELTQRLNAPHNGD